MKLTEHDVHAALDPVVSDLSLSQWDKQRMLQVAMAAGRKKRKSYGFFRRAMAVTAAVAICLTTSMVVLASPTMSEKLSRLSRQTLRYLTPVTASCEDNGISMEVLASMQDEATVICYVSFMDTTGQNRLDESMELCDVRIDGEPTVITGYPMQQEDGSVVVRMQGLRDPMQSMGGKVSITLNTILSQGDEIEFSDTGITVGDIKQWNPEPSMGGTMPIRSAYNYVGNGSLSKRVEADTMQVMKPIGSYVDKRVPFLEFQNAGVLNHELHILAKRSEDSWYNSCNFALYGADGEPLLEDSAEFCVGRQFEKSNPYSQHDTEQVEYVMSLPEGADLDEISLYYSTKFYQHCLDGQWDLTFSVMEDQMQKTYVSCKKDMESWTLQSVEVSPFGVVCTGTGVLLENSAMPEVCLYLKDGTQMDNFSSGITSVQMGTDGEPDQISCKEYFDEPLDLDELESISVNGQQIWKNGR